MEQYQSFPVKTIPLDTLGLPSALIALWEKLHEMGQGFYIVGGAVRDLLLQRIPKEFDCCTALSMEALERYASSVGFNCKVLNKDLEVMSLEIDQIQFEVARLRTETDYADKRHPNQVAFTDSIEVDSHRRDFTINAFYLAYTGQVFDFHQGFEHLKRGEIRVIGSSEEKFQQDALRLLRGVRFAAGLGFNLPHDIFLAMQSNAFSLRDISVDRRMAELRLMLEHPNWHRALFLMENGGILDSGFHLAPVTTALHGDLPGGFKETFARVLALQTVTGPPELIYRLEQYHLSRDEKRGMLMYLWSYAHRNRPLDILFRQGQHLSALKTFFKGFKNPDVQEVQDYFWQCEVQGLPLTPEALALSVQELIIIGAVGPMIKAVLEALFIGVHRGIYTNDHYVLRQEAQKILSVNKHSGLS